MKKTSKNEISSVDKAIAEAQVKKADPKAIPDENGVLTDFEDQSDDGVEFVDNEEGEDEESLEEEKAPVKPGPKKKVVEDDEEEIDEDEDDEEGYF